MDRALLLKAEAKKILHDIKSGKVEENPALLLRFLVISFADLKNWKVYYNVAFPSLIFDSKITLLSLKLASQVLKQEEATSLSNAFTEWRKSSETTVVPFFLINISPDSSATIRQLKDWKACQGNGQKLLFGFYDHGNRGFPGWALRNYIAFVSCVGRLRKFIFSATEKNEDVLTYSSPLSAKHHFRHLMAGMNLIMCLKQLDGKEKRPGRNRKR